MSRTMNTEERKAVAKRVTDILALNDKGSKVWIGQQGQVRVYVTRQLSQGTTQDMGWIEIQQDGSRGYCLDRNAAGIRNAVEKGLENDQGN